MDKKLKIQEPSWFKWWSWSWRRKGDNEAGTAKRQRKAASYLTVWTHHSGSQPTTARLLSCLEMVSPTPCLYAWQLGAFKPYPSTSSCAHIELIREPGCSQPLMLARDSNHASHVCMGVILLALLSNHHKNWGQRVCVCVCVCARARAHAHVLTHTLSSHFRPPTSSRDLNYINYKTFHALLAYMCGINNLEI